MKKLILSTVNDVLKTNIAKVENGYITLNGICMGTVQTIPSGFVLWLFIQGQMTFAYDDLLGTPQAEASHISAVTEVMDAASCRT